jgi:lipopolysaccharide export LptBFGC system permease protein LptF
MSMAILTFLLLVRTVFTESDSIAGTLSAQASLKALGCLMPTLLTLTFPMSLLVGTLLGIGRLTVDSEVKAFRTHGVNLFRTFVPILLFGCLTAGVILVNSLYFAPWMMSKIYALLDSATLGVVDAVEPGRFEDRLRVEGADAVFYFKERDPETKQLKNVYMCLEGGDPFNLTENGKTGEAKTSATSKKKKSSKIAASTIQGLNRIKGAMDEPPSPAMLGLGVAAAKAQAKARPLKKPELQPDLLVKTLILASTGNLYTDEATGKAFLELHNGTIHFMGDRKEPDYHVFHFDSLKQSIMTGKDGIGGSSKEIDDRILGLTLTDMGDEIAYRQGVLKEKGEEEKEAKQKETGDKAKDKKPPREQRDIYAMAAATYQRISISLACFAFVLIGVPLAIYIRPSGKSVGISVAFGLLLVFYGFLYSGEHLTRSGSLALGPFFMFLPIVLLSGIGAYLLHRVVHR